MQANKVVSRLEVATSLKIDVVGGDLYEIFKSVPLTITDIS